MKMIYSRDLSGEQESSVSGGREEARVDVAHALEQLLHFLHLVAVDDDLRHLTVEGDGLSSTHTYNKY